MEKATTSVVLALLSLNFLVGIPFSLFYSSSATYVGGHISQDTTWRLLDSPYVATSDIILDSGATLTIEPGVEVRFYGNFSLTVYGSLYAVGTNTSQITFTSNEAKPSAGDWNTLKFLGGGNSSFVLKHCVVEYALNGVTIQSQQIAIIGSCEISNNLYGGISVVGRANILIDGNILELNDYGIIGSGSVSSGVVVTNNSILHNNYGVYIHTTGSAKSLIENMTFTSNNFSHNKYGIFLYSGKIPPFYSTSSHITNFVISGNLFSFCQNGIYMETRSWGSNYPDSWDNSYIYDGVISNNTLFFNEYGIYLYSGGAWYRYVYDIALSGNVVSSNIVGMYLNAHRYELVEFDVTLTDNVFSANEKGVNIERPPGVPVVDTVRTNITRNSISYNSYGIMYTATKNHVAHYNDIYFNSIYGMYVEDATVNAENNYWGNPTGPFHELNPDGKGNPVNGNGTDLDFTPFLQEPLGRINMPPYARLEVDRSKAALNQTFTFDASASSDDDRVYMYFFDFGDGNGSSTTASAVTHAYLSVGTYEILLAVVDNLGVKSVNIAKASVIVTEELVPLIVFIDLNSTVLLPNKSLAITVWVTSDESPVSGAAVTLSSDKGGTFSTPNGTTSSDGYFNSSFTPPPVTTQTLCTITVNATKSGYASGQDQSQVILMSTPQGRSEPPFNQALIVVVVCVVGTVVATIILGKRKRKKRRRRLLLSKKRTTSSVTKHAQRKFQGRLQTTHSTSFV